jgi:hypothetical protein
MNKIVLFIITLYNKHSVFYFLHSHLFLIIFKTYGVVPCVGPYKGSTDNSDIHIYIERKRKF